MGDDIVNVDGAISIIPLGTPTIKAFPVMMKVMVIIISIILMIVVIPIVIVLLRIINEVNPAQEKATLPKRIINEI